MHDSLIAKPSAVQNIYDGIATENILIEGDDASHVAATPKPTKQLSRFELNNRSHARIIELTLFEGGWLSIRDHRRKTPGNARLVNLSYIDPAPEISRFTAEKTLHVVLALLALALLSGTLAYLLIWTNLMTAVAVVSAVAAACTFLAYVYRTQERVIFRSQTGRAPVISLLATLGCFRACRALVPQLVEAIKQAQNQAPNAHNKTEQLREEMREHYRLKDIGLISADVCAASTQRILTRFD